MRFTSQWLMSHLAKNKVREPQTIEADPGSEAELHEKIIAECQRRLWVCIHSRMDRKATNQCGTPDFIIAGTTKGIAPNLAESPVVFVDQPATWFIEAKSRTGKLSPAQNAMRHHLESLGHRYHVVRSFEEFLSVL